MPECFIGWRETLLNEKRRRVCIVQNLNMSDNIVELLTDDYLLLENVPLKNIAPFSKLVGDCSCVKILTSNGRTGYVLIGARFCGTENANNDDEGKFVIPSSFCPSYSNEIQGRSLHFLVLQ